VRGRLADLIDSLNSDARKGERVTGARRRVVFPVLDDFLGLVADFQRADAVVLLLDGHASSL
jgi:hypothetical protein